MATSYRLLDWIDESRLETIRICMNKNPLAMKIIEKRVDGMITEDWCALAEQEHLKDFLCNNLHRICHCYSLTYNSAYGYILHRNKTLNNKYKLSIINWTRLSANEHPDAIKILQKNVHKIDWRELSGNSMAIELLALNKDRIAHERLWLNSNPNKVYLLDISKCNRLCFREFVGMANLDDQRYYIFILNNIDAILTKIKYRTYMDYIWQNLSNVGIIMALLRTCSSTDCKSLSNRPEMIDIVRNNPNIIDWGQLSANPAAIDILKAHPEKIDWKQLSLNPAAIDVLSMYPEKIDWENLCRNKNAYDIILMNQDKIDWNVLIETENPIFSDLLSRNLHKIDKINLVICGMNSEWKMRMMMDYDFEFDDEAFEDPSYFDDFIANASTDLEFEFIRRHFDEHYYYNILGQNANIFC